MPLVVAQFTFPVTAWSGSTGELLIAYSLLTNHQRGKVIGYVIGILLLWASIFYFIGMKNGEQGVVFGTVTAIPLAVCTIISFAGGYIKKGWQWMWAKL